MCQNSNCCNPTSITIPVGPQGPQGPAGPAGATGANGTDGNTILYGIVAPTTEGVDGDFYIDTVTNMLYGPKAAGVWPAGTSLVGPTGATGATGSTGAAGATGATGAAGADGASLMDYNQGIDFGIGGRTVFIDNSLLPTEEDTIHLQYFIYSSTAATFYISTSPSIPPPSPIWSDTNTAGKFNGWNEINIKLTRVGSDMVGHITFTNTDGITNFRDIQFLTITNWFSTGTVTLYITSDIVNPLEGMISEIRLFKYLRE